MKNGLKWTFGVLFALAGLGSMVDSPISGVIYILTGMFLMPPILAFLEKKSNIKIPSTGKYLIVFAGMISAYMFRDESGVNPFSKIESSGAKSIKKEDNIVSTKIGVGEVLSTEYFDVVVNNVTTSEKVRTGNQYTDLNAEPGISYLILNVTYKNTDNESRMISEGAVFINYGGKVYQYDKSEPIMAEGWGIFLDQINPLTSKTTNIVYKIPTEIKGSAYYEPGRNFASKRIYLGDL
jgi:hypothetical protein